MSQTPAAAQLDSAGREPFVDVLRAVALAGIGLMNVEWFTRPMQALGTGPAATDQGLDRVLAWLVVVLVQGKFWILFALLFGAGMAMQVGTASAEVLSRRLWLLLALGIAHAVLLWPGDILHTYALAGLLLLWWWPAQMPPERKGAFGVSLYVGIMFMSLLLGLALLRVGQDTAAMRDWAALTAQAAQVYADGDWSQATAQRVRDVLQLLRQEMLIVPSAMGVFLIGMGQWRGGAWRAGATWPHRAALPWLAASGLALSVLGAWLLARYVDVIGWQVVAGALLGLGALPLALAYATGLWLLWQRDGMATHVLRTFAPMGRMSLTHYLTQSLVFAWVFHGYGLGLWGQLDRADQLGLVVLVVALQWAVSPLWLRRFRYGPMEWLWRWASHGGRVAWRG